MKKDTKSTILVEALTLFSIHGYEGVTVQDIAAAVGIKAPSLYKHYQSKQDIFDAILAKMEQRYKEQTGSMQMDGTNAMQDKDFFLKISQEQLIKMGKEFFLYFLHDEYILKFRRMLTIEKYRSSDLSALYAKQYIDNPLTYQGMLFQLLGGVGMLSQGDSHIMALQFYAPLYLMLVLCDCHPEREEEALQTLERHIEQFSRLYQAREI